MRLKLVGIRYDNVAPTGVFLEFDVLDEVQQQSTPHVQIETKTDDIAGFMMQQLMNSMQQALTPPIRKEEKPERYWILWIDKQNFDKFNAKEPLMIGKVYYVTFQPKTIEMDADMDE